MRINYRDFKTGFSSLTDTPSCSNSCSQRSSRGTRRRRKDGYRLQGYHQDSRSRSCDILEETDDDLETDNDVLASCDELDEDGDDLPILEKVKEIITQPEETWRYPFNDEERDVKVEEVHPSDNVSCCGSLGNFSTTTKPELIQPKLECDILSMFKVSSAAQWKSISSNVEINLSEVNDEVTSCESFVGVKCDEVTRHESQVEVKSDVATEDERQMAVKSDEVTRHENQAGVKPPEVTKKQLLAVCWTVKPWECPKDRRLFTSLYAAGWGCDCDEVTDYLTIPSQESRVI